MLRRVYRVGPGQVLVETYIDHRQARQRRPHDIQLPRDGQLHLVETHAAYPGEMRVGQQQAAAIGRALRAHRNGVAATAHGELLLPGQGHAVVDRGPLRRKLGRGRRHHGLGELAYATFGQQASGQLDQVQAGDRAHPVARPALGGQALGPTLAQGAVIAAGIAVQQVAHRCRLCLQEAVDCNGVVEPGEEQVAGEIVALLHGLAVTTEVARALAVDRQHLVGQQAQVVLGVGIADAIAQATLVIGQDVRHTKAGAADLRRGFAASLARLRQQAGGNQGGGEAKAQGRTRKRDHRHSSCNRGLSRSDEWPDENFTPSCLLQRLQQGVSDFFTEGLQFCRSRSS